MLSVDVAEVEDYFVGVFGEVAEGGVGNEEYYYVGCAEGFFAVGEVEDAVVGEVGL